MSVLRIMPIWAVAMAGCVCIARAEVVTEANARAAEIVSTIPQTPVAVRAMAITQVAVFDAIQSIAGDCQPIVLATAAPADASVDAAVLSATRTALLSLVPAQQTAIDADYQAQLSALPDNKARADGIAAGERAANAVLAARASDGANTPDRYVPRTTAGVYVPTTHPLLPWWGQRKPWLMSKPTQFHPAPPPVLDSDAWRRDLREVAALGKRASAERTVEQTAMARFWETTSPNVYWHVVRSVAASRDASAGDNALLFARAAMAMDDAMIAVFEAKYAYEFWRPITAIRNGSAGVHDTGWEPVIDTPMHPEYPCAHCIVSSAVGVVLEDAIGDGPCPVLRSSSPTAGNTERTWTSVADFVNEVGEARIDAGVHYRNSVDVARAMGRQVGTLAVRWSPAPGTQANRKVTDWR